MEKRNGNKYQFLNVFIGLHDVNIMNETAEKHPLNTPTLMELKKIKTKINSEK